MSEGTERQEKGIIGRVMIDGFPVVYKLVDASPSEDTIDFYEDSHWNDFEKLRASFHSAPHREAQQ